MAPSYEDKDVVLVQLNEYKEKNPKRFDPVVVWGEEYGYLLFKRVIGLPGEKIEIKKGHIFINDIELKDNFGKGYDIFWDMEPVIVPKNQYFIIGDNRGDSVYGFFMKEEILGKSLY
jgi:signal peptidase I